VTGQVERMVTSLFGRMRREARLARTEARTLRDLGRRLAEADQPCVERAKGEGAEHE